MRSSVVSVLARMLIWLYKLIYQLSVQNSGLDMLTPTTIEVEAGIDSASVIKNCESDSATKRPR